LLGQVENGRCCFPAAKSWPISDYNGTISGPRRDVGLLALSFHEPHDRFHQLRKIIQQAPRIPAGINVDSKYSRFGMK
jgi:hypothetical protein